MEEQDIASMKSYIMVKLVCRLGPIQNLIKSVLDTFILIQQLAGYKGTVSTKIKGRQI